MAHVANLEGVHVGGNHFCPLNEKSPKDHHSEGRKGEISNKIADLVLLRPVNEGKIYTGSKEPERGTVMHADGNTRLYK